MNRGKKMLEMVLNRGIINPDTQKNENSGMIIYL